MLRKNGKLKKKKKRKEKKEINLSPSGWKRAEEVKKISVILAPGKNVAFLPLWGKSFSSCMAFIAYHNIYLLRPRVSNSI